MPPSPHATRLLRDYLRAKDAQVPRLFTRVFTPDAAFVPRYAIPGPFGDAQPHEGRPAVVEAFRELGRMSENILTVVPEDSVEESPGRLRSRWVVAMTRRESGAGFVGWGDYDWSLAECGRARRLAVDFLGLAPLTPQDAPAVLDRMLDLPHPIVADAVLVQAVGDLPGLPKLRDWLERGGAVA